MYTFKESIFRLVRFLQVGGSPYTCRLNMAEDQVDSGHFENSNNPKIVKLYLGAIQNIAKQTLSNHPFEFDTFVQKK